MPGLLALAVALGAVATAAGVMTGNWRKAEVTEEEAQLLQSALARMDAENNPHKRVGVAQILELETQVVAGTNYRFTVAGRDLSTASGGADDARDALPVQRFVIQVWEQPWTNTLRVTDVTAVQGTADEL